MATSGFSRRAGLDGFDAGTGFVDDVEIGLTLQNVAQALAHEGVVVGQQDANGHYAMTSFLTGASGMRRAMRVPCAGRGVDHQGASGVGGALAHAEQSQSVERLRVLRQIRGRRPPPPPAGIRRAGAR